MVDVKFSPVVPKSSKDLRIEVIHFRGGTMKRLAGILFISFVFFGCENEELSPTYFGTTPINIGDTIRIEKSLKNAAGEESLIFQRDSSIHIHWSFMNDTQDSLKYFCDSETPWIHFSLFKINNGLMIDIINSPSCTAWGYMSSRELWVFDTILSSADTGSFQVVTNVNFMPDESWMDCECIISGNYNEIIQIVE